MYKEKEAAQSDIFFYPYINSPSINVKENSKLLLSLPCTSSNPQLIKGTRRPPQV
jgi:hypothetical protein